jgi:glycosyltransferase involved in cell wall biosynthesis
MGDVKLAYVIVRYGAEVLGGAEQGCRMLAERLAARPGWDVEVFTTCALDASTWADHFPPGTQQLAGVTVHRFASERGRDRRFDQLSEPVLRDPARTTPEDQRRWIDRQGPVCPDTIEAAAASDADLVVFYPYLYWPTVQGVPLVASRAVMHPAAHDEQPLRLPIFVPIFDAVQGFVFQTDAERRLTESIFPSVISKPQLLMGLGVEERAGEARGFLEDRGLQNIPYLLCLGRVDDGKGAHLLARFFAAYKARRPGPLQLVFAGQIVNRPADHPDVVVTGPLSEDEKWGALRRAIALVSPSPFEAFSIVLMEAWTVGLPVLVHGRSDATVEHTRRSGGGLVFTGYGSFEVALDRLLADAQLRQSMGAAGRTYVTENFAWADLIDRYSAFLERVAARRLPGRSSLAV